jgi:DNA-directed RNA polymerase subunit RPC12/RpoP
MQEVDIMSGINKLVKAGWPWWYSQVYGAVTKHYRCPNDFSKMEIPNEKDIPWEVRRRTMDETLLRCPKCGHKLGDWYIKLLKDQYDKGRLDLRVIDDMERKVKELCGMPRLPIDMPTEEQLKEILTNGTTATDNTSTTDAERP